MNKWIYFIGIILSSYQLWITYAQFRAVRVLENEQNYQKLFLSIIINLFVYSIVLLKALQEGYKIIKGRTNTFYAIQQFRETKLI